MLQKLIFKFQKYVVYHLDYISLIVNFKNYCEIGFVIIFLSKTNKPVDPDFPWWP